jgi:uncharacterized protein
MPGSLYSRYGARDVEAMARRESVVSGEIGLEKLTRLAGLLDSDHGSVKARLHFRQHGGGWPIIELEYDTSVRLVCQRCLEPVDYRIKDRVDLAVLESAALEQHLPEGYEPLLLEDGRLMPATLIEDEIIIALPLVPRHEPAEACASPDRPSSRSL